MIHTEFKYVDTAIGGVHKRNHVVDVSEFRIPIGKTDCYRTYFRFGDDYKIYFEKHKTVAGYSGMCYADAIPIDIDDQDLKQAWHKTNTLIELLHYDYEFDVRHLFFSGASGFHIFLASNAFDVFKPSDSLHITFKNIVAEISSDDINVDMKIYDQNRLLRLSNTKNSKSGLYKIPLERDEFQKGIDFILDCAKTTRECFHPAFRDTIVNQQFTELYKRNRSKQIVQTNRNDVISKIKLGVDQGARNDTTASIAGLLRSKGIDKELCTALVTGWNMRNDPPLEEEEIATTVDSIYRYENRCNADEIKPVWSIAQNYQTYVRSEKKIDIGISFIDNKIRGIRPGQVMMILGFTGNFKTGLLQWIMSHYMRTTGEPVLLFELEMSDLDLFERAAQMTLEKSGHEIENILKVTENDEFIEKIKSAHQNFFIVDKPALSFNDLINYIDIAEKKIGKEIALIGIDFLQLMSGIGSTNVQKMDYIAKELKTFAKQVRKPVIALSQVTGVDDEFERISLMDVRDSKTIGQMSDYCISIRLKKGRDDVQILDILKNRKGGRCSGEIKIDRKTMNLREI